MEMKLNKASFSVTTLQDESDESAFWLSKTPAERLEALEFMRQTVFGYDPTPSRLQRILTVTQLK